MESSSPSELSQLNDMFPDLDYEVLESIYVAFKGDLSAAIGELLGDDSLPVVPPLPVVSHWPEHLVEESDRSTQLTCKVCSKLYAARGADRSRGANLLCGRCHATTREVSGSGETDPILQKLLRAIESIPQQRWLDAATEFRRPPIEDRAVSQSFLHELMRSLKCASPQTYTQLNSYMITGSKSLECACEVGQLENCKHWLESGKNPGLCQQWVFRSFLARSTCLSLIETLMIARDLTGDDTFTHDPSGEPFFGRATIFISYFWQARYHPRPV